MADEQGRHARPNQKSMAELTAIDARRSMATEPNSRYALATLPLCLAWLGSSLRLGRQQDSLAQGEPR